MEPNIDDDVKCYRVTSISGLDVYRIIPPSQSTPEVKKPSTIKLSTERHINPNPRMARGDVIILGQNQDLSETLRESLAPLFMVDRRSSAPQPGPSQAGPTKIFPSSHSSPVVSKPVSLIQDLTLDQTLELPIAKIPQVKKPTPPPAVKQGNLETRFEDSESSSEDERPAGKPVDTRMCESRFQETHYRPRPRRRRSDEPMRVPKIGIPPSIRHLYPRR
jgi:hypothetical protein